MCATSLFAYTKFKLHLYGFINYMIKSFKCSYFIDIVLFIFLLYWIHVNSEIDEDITSNEVATCLQLINFLETNRQEYMKETSLVVKIVRLMCVFLCGMLLLWTLLRLKVNWKIILIFYFFLRFFISFINSLGLT